MKKHRGFAAGVLVMIMATLVGGCALVGNAQGSDSGTKPAPVDLDGTKWTLTKIDGETVVASGKGTLDFAAGNASGVSFCNSFSGSYEQDGSKLSFGMLMSTLMACDDAGPETEYLAALAEVTGAQLDGDTLVLTNDAGDDILAYSPAQHAGLEDTSWDLTGYNTGSGISSLILDSTISATLTDGNIEGTAGCNHYSGSYTLDGTAIEVGPVASTEMYCMDPEGVMDQEAAYLQALAAAATYEIDRTTLTIADAGGTTLLTFEVAGD